MILDDDDDDDDDDAIRDFREPQNIFSCFVENRIFNLLLQIIYVLQYF